MSTSDQHVIQSSGTPRFYYGGTIDEFLKQSENEIMGMLFANCIVNSTSEEQKDAWLSEIEILKNQLSSFNEGSVLFEYIVPRIGRRIDVVLLLNNVVFLLEFKCNANIYRKEDCQQVANYAADLFYFHKESSDKYIIPILVATEAGNVNNEVTEIRTDTYANSNAHIFEPMKCNKNNLYNTLNLVLQLLQPQSFEYNDWIHSDYYPNRTIVEAAQELYRNHQVREIQHRDASDVTFDKTLSSIDDIIEYSQENNAKSICFVTGVPGAGKTLVGLELAVRYSNDMDTSRAVYLSGNQYLVKVLREALARDRKKQNEHLGIENGKRIDEYRRETETFIQIIHHYRNEYLNSDEAPNDHIVIFDEAQRAWTNEHLSKFIRSKKTNDEDLTNSNNQMYTNYSEPEFLIQTLNRHDDWAVIVCLVGGGQEINRGEAGLPEWFDSLRRSFRDWSVFVSSNLRSDEYLHGRTWEEMTSGLKIHTRNELHLSTSKRSVRSPDVFKFIDAMLDNDIAKARSLYQEIENDYPIVMTRDFDVAKRWIRNESRGNTRFGLLASKDSKRLKPIGIYVASEIKVERWFLNDATDINSSYALEDAATEFKIQGLELDYSLVAWDANFRYEDDEWTYWRFGNKDWNHVRQSEARRYLKNAYRVLLTRARLGMVLLIPKGDKNDATRKPEYYDGIYEYFKKIGIKELPE